MTELFNVPMVNLTVVNGENGKIAGEVALKTSRLLAYEQHTGFTRVRLTAGWYVDVKEGTDEIDRRLRRAAA
jgi:hypothetical protein